MGAEIDRLEVQIETQAKNANLQLDILERKLNNVAKYLTGINGNSLSNFSKNTKTVESNIHSTANTFSSFASGAKKATKSTKSLVSAIGMFYANYFMVIRGIKKLGSAVKSSMDYVETFNYWNVTLDKIGKEFGNQYERFGKSSAEEYAQSFSDRLKELTQKMTGYSVGDNGELIDFGAKNLGLDVESIMKFQAKIGAVTNSVGLMGETSINTAKALSMLAADMSSFTNKDLSQVMTNMQSGLIGQSRAMYKYGIDITNATLQTYAYKYGLSMAVSEMTQADKMQLRLLAILDQSRIAWGDQANTINSVANQYRIFRQQVSNLARVIGNLFLPIAQRVLPVINGIIIAVRRLFELLGFKIWGGDWLKDIADGISIGAAGFDDVTDDIDEVTDSLDDASGAAKKFKHQLQGFDALNVLTTSEGAGKTGSAFGGLLDMSDAIADILADYEAVWNKAFEDAENKAQEIADAIINAFKNAFEDGGWFGVGKMIGDWITNGLDSIDWDKTYQGARNFGTGLAQFLNGLISPELFGAVGRTIAGSLNTALWFLNSFGKTFDWKDFGLSIATSINEFFRTFDFALLADTINVWAKGILDTIITFLDKTDWNLIGKQIGTFLAELDFTEIGGKIGKAIWKAINAGIDVWKGSFSVAPFETILLSLSPMKKALKAITTSKIVKGISSITKDFKILLSGGLIEKSNIFSKLADAIALTVGGAGTLKESINAIFGKNTTTILGIGSVVSEFLLLNDAFYDIASGSDNLVASLAEIAIGAGLAVGALKLIGLSNPYTAAIVGITGVISAICGIKKAIDESIDEAQISSMFDSIRINGETSMDALGDVFKDTIDEISDGADATREKLASISNTQEGIDGTVESINSIKTAIENGAYSVEEKVPEIIAQFDTLLSSTKSIFEEEYEVIVGNIVGAYADILTAQGKSVPEMVAGFAALRDEVTAVYADTEAQIASLEEEYNSGAISADEYYEKVMPLYKILHSASSDGELSAVADEIRNLGGALDLSQYISENSFDVSGFQSYIDTVTQKATEGKDNLISLEDEFKKSLDEFKESVISTGVDANQADFAAVYGASDTQVENIKTKINSAYQDYTDQLQYCLLQQLPGVVDEATKNYDELGWQQKMFTTKADFVQGAIDEWENNILTPVTNSIKGELEELGLDGSTWANEAAKKITDSIFNTITESSYEGVEIDTTTLKDNYASIIQNALDGASEAIDADSYGKDTIDGFSNGITDNKQTSIDAINEWMASLDTAIHDSELKFGSPSKRTEEYGKWTIDGFNKGIGDNVNSTTLTIQRYIDGVVSVFNRISVQMSIIGAQTMQGFINGMSSMTDKVYERAQKIANLVAGTIRTALDIHSPSKVMFSLGEYTVEGFNLGIENMYDNLKNSFGKYTANTVDYLKADAYTYDYSGMTGDKGFTDNYYASDFGRQNDMQETNKLLRELVSAVKRGSTIEIDGEEVFRVTQKKADEFYKQTGYSPYYA